jgi:hypothetical protein
VRPSFEYRKISPVSSARSEKRSSVESQNAPNADCSCSACATLPSMKSKMFATSMITNASPKLPRASAHAAATLMMTPTSVSVFGWIRSRTHSAIRARSGNMHAAPIKPVKVIGLRRPAGSIVMSTTRIMEGSDYGQTAE